MGLRRLSPVFRVSRSENWISLDSRYTALTAAFYTICSSLLVILLYGWRFVENSQHPEHLRDVYWGVQIAYLATIVSHLIIIALSCCLLPAICKERMSLVTQWVVAIVSLMAFEAVCCCYSNVLRDHINKKFDVICKAEILFFASRSIFNILSLWSVMRFLKNISSGITFRDPETIEL